MNLETIRVVKKRGNLYLVYVHVHVWWLVRIRGIIYCICDTVSINIILVFKYC